MILAHINTLPYKQEVIIEGENWIGANVTIISGVTY